MSKSGKSTSAKPDSTANLGFEAKLWLAVPPPAIARRFDELTAPLMAKIKANSTESRTLATLRDTLLPKLLSGELSVAPMSVTNI